MLGGFEAKGANAKITRNHPTAGVIPNGGICEPPVEKLVPNILNERGELSFILPRPSAFNATEITKAINRLMTTRKAGFARIEDPGNVRVRLLPAFRGRNAVNGLLAEIEALRIKPEQEAVVLINEKTGTIIVSGNVRVMPCAVNVASLTIEVTEDELVSQPNPGISRGTSEKVGRTNIRVTEGSNKTQKLDGGASLNELLAGLQALGVEGRKLGTVLSSLHRMGLLHGKARRSVIPSPALPDPATALSSAQQRPLRQELGMPNEEQALEAARNFESLLLHQLVRDMRGNASAFGEGMFGSSPGSGQHEALFDDLMAKRLAESGRVGIADALVRSWKESGRISSSPAIGQETPQRSRRVDTSRQASESASSGRVSKHATRHTRRMLSARARQSSAWPTAVDARASPLPRSVRAAMASSWLRFRDDSSTRCRANWSSAA